MDGIGSIPDFDFQVEMPSASIDEEARSVTVTAANGLMLEILSPEDLALEKLRMFIYWEEAGSADHVVAILRLEDLDTARLDRRAAKEKYLSQGLEVLREWGDNHDRNERMELEEAHALAKKDQSRHVTRLMRTMANALRNIQEADAPQRRRPRDPDSAEFLRGQGTSEALVGPVVSYAEYDRSYRQMRDFFVR